MTQKFVETFFVSRQVAGICKGPCVLRKAGIFFLQSSCCEFHMPTGSGLSEKAFRAVVPVFYILIRFHFASCEFLVLLILLLLFKISLCICTVWTLFQKQVLECWYPCLAVRLRISQIGYVPGHWGQLHHPETWSIRRLLQPVTYIWGGISDSLRPNAPIRPCEPHPGTLSSQHFQAPRELDFMGRLPTSGLCCQQALPSKSSHFHTTTSFLVQGDSIMSLSLNYLFNSLLSYLPPLDANLEQSSYLKMRITWTKIWNILCII